MFSALSIGHKILKLGECALPLALLTSIHWDRKAFSFYQEIHHWDKPCKANIVVNSWYLTKTTEPQYIQWSSATTTFFPDHGNPAFHNLTHRLLCYSRPEDDEEWQNFFKLMWRIWAPNEKRLIHFLWTSPPWTLSLPQVPIGTYKFYSVQLKTNLIFNGEPLGRERVIKLTHTSHRQTITIGEVLLLGLIHTTR